MSDADSDSTDRAMFWVNLVGFGLAFALLGAFFVLYGPGFLGLIIVMFGGGPNLPDR